MQESLCQREVIDSLEVTFFEAESGYDQIDCLYVLIKFYQTSSHKEKFFEYLKQAYQIA